MRVAILPTGLTEWYGLSRALGRLFPDHEFYCLPTEAEVQSNPDRFPYSGFTSTALTQEHLSEPPEAASELISRAAQEALGDRRHTAADMVVVVDDVELANLSHVDRVVAVMHEAAVRHLERLEANCHFERTKVALRQKVSFHLIAPMVEAWLFSDRQALAAAGVPEGAQVVFAPTTDPEAFETHDPAYLDASELDCPALAGLSNGRKKKLRPKWLGTQPRVRHPKGYLQWLCRAPDEKNCTRYSETDTGGPALAGLCWQAVGMRDPEHFALLRALVEDLSEGLNASPAFAIGTPHGNPPTLLSNAPRSAVLRNI